MSEVTPLSPEPTGRVSFAHLFLRDCACAPVAAGAAASIEASSRP